MRDPRPGLFADNYRDIRMQVRVFLRHQFGGLVDVDEVADAAMERLFVHWQEVADPLLWTLTVARNRALDELRKAPVAQLEEEMTASNAMPVSTFGVAEQQLKVTTILQALHALSPSQHRVVVLAALGFSNGEIAGITRLAVNSVAHYLYEGRKSLKTILQQQRRPRPKHPHRSVRPPGKS